MQHLYFRRSSSRVKLAAVLTSVALGAGLVGLATASNVNAAADSSDDTGLEAAIDGTEAPPAGTEATGESADGPVSGQVVCTPGPAIQDPNSNIWFKHRYQCETLADAQVWTPPTSPKHEAIALLKKGSQFLVCYSNTLKHDTIDKPGMPSYWTLTKADFALDGVSPAPGTGWAWVSSSEVVGDPIAAGIEECGKARDYTKALIPGDHPLPKKVVKKPVAAPAPVARPAARSTRNPAPTATSAVITRALADLDRERRSGCRNISEVAGRGQAACDTEIAKRKKNIRDAAAAASR